MNLAMQPPAHAQNAYTTEERRSATCGIRYTDKRWAMTIVASSTQQARLSWERYAGTVEYR